MGVHSASPIVTVLSDGVELNFSPEIRSSPSGEPTKKRFGVHLIIR